MKELIKKAKLGYPNLYTDFSDGVGVSNNEIKQFIQKGLEKIKQKMLDDDLKESFFSFATGNTIVFGEIYRQQNKLFNIFISVSKNYIHKTFTDVEL